MHINHMKLTCTTDDDQHGFICGTARDNHELFNVMVMTRGGWKSRFYHRDRVTLTEDAYKNVDAALLKELGLNRPEPVIEKVIEVGDKVTWHYESTRGWGWSLHVPATVIKITAKRVTIEAELKDGGTKRVSVKPEKLKFTQVHA